jgi:BTB/POZ domain
LSDLQTIIANKPHGLKLEFSRNMEENMEGTCENSDNLAHKLSSHIEETCENPEENRDHESSYKLLLKSKNVEDVLDKGHFADVYFVFPRDKRVPKYKNIACHRVILSLASKEFYKRFRNEWAGKERISLEAYTFKVFNQFIRFIYLRDPSIDQATSIRDLVELYSIVEEFSSKSLKRLCVQEVETRLQTASLDDLVPTLDSPSHAQILKDLILSNIISHHLNGSTFLWLAKVAHKNAIESLFMETAR